ncbi:MAG: acetyl-CoA C-acetyltransferase [Deltaproteobacteria bacterium]|nr:acetyl-CoA C-acetyltransferase [Deltaproteobacteria bacterium]MBW1930859.1 acetyl-CoA C-acetyltransferase [Deltaproteobacteria bacterium]MBW2025602.1 acetyl-CoA C-acetyltransferase [Deltaproteobacteria bacterium]MBW2125509.1 acetyl-CoA C-acetyltransferase [Deltaproteobacteria bacterium]RLB24642.1 MAG: acetyl-CoA C-acyltransferase [Deltaproteobacteria bacterium]
MRDVVIVSACRTPVGDFAGSLSTVSATDLGALVIKEAISRAGITNDDVDEVIMGCVLPHGLGQNPARQSMVRAGLPWGVGAITVNKVCGSGLKAVMLAAQAIKCGDADVVVAGGQENMNLCPYMLEKARTGYRMNNSILIDGMVHDGLWDHVNDFHMGMSAELVADKYGVTREDMDEFALNSYQKAWKAIEEGKFKDEIIPVQVPVKKGEPKLFDTDEIPLRKPKTSAEALARLRPAFKKNGRVTAGNASKISDGASALVVMSREKAEALGCKPLVRVGAQGSAGIDMKYVLVAPIYSIPKVLAKDGLKVGDVDLHEINEAFSSSSVAINRELGLDPAKVNINGGAVALGHPIGASGARVLTTLIYAMKDKDAEIGQATLCLGGGEAVTLVVYNEP